MASRTTTDPLEILIEMGVDLDNLSSEEDYLSALMEAAATIEFQTKGSGDERSAALRKEIIAVRKKRKAADPKFKAKTAKISKSSFKPKSVEPEQKALPSSSLVPYQNPEKKTEETGEIKKKDVKEDKSEGILSSILKNIIAIKGLLKDRLNVTKSIKEIERKNLQKKKRKNKEDKLETDKEGKGFLKKLKGALPRLNMFDAIFNWIKNVIIGRILIKIVDWMSDPKNRKKLESLGKFLKDWWPTLTAAFLLFATPLGGFVRSIVGGMVKLTAFLIKTAIPTLVKLIAKNPIAAVLATAAGIGAAAGISQMSQQENEPIPGDTDSNISSRLNNILDVGGYSGGGQTVFPKSIGTDTIPAMLSPGEFVMSKGAVDKFGSGFMESINSAGGGTNKPVFKEGTTYAEGGGGIMTSKEAHEKFEKLEPGSGKKISVPGVGSIVAGKHFGRPRTKYFDKNGKLLENSFATLKMSDRQQWEKGYENVENNSQDKKEDKKEDKKIDAGGYGAILDLIGKRESDSVGGYNAVNQGGADGGHTVLGYSGDYRKAPFNKSGKSLTSMTVQEIMDLQYDDRSLSDSQWKKSGKLHAVGRYQIIGDTLKGLINQGVASPEEKFTPSVQNKLGIALIKQTGGSVSRLKSTWVGLRKESDSTVSSAMSAGGATTSGGHGAGSGSNSGDTSSDSNSNSTYSDVDLSSLKGTSAFSDMFAGARDALAKPSNQVQPSVNLSSNNNYSSTQILKDQSTGILSARNIAASMGMDTQQTEKLANKASEFTKQNGSPPTKGDLLSLTLSGSVTQNPAQMLRLPVDALATDNLKPTSGSNDIRTINLPPVPMSSSGNKTAVKGKVTEVPEFSTTSQHYLSVQIRAMVHKNTLGGDVG